MHSKRSLRSLAHSQALKHEKDIRNYEKDEGSADDKEKSQAEE